MNSCTVSLNDFFPRHVAPGLLILFKKTFHASMLYNDYPSTVMTLSDDARLGFKLYLLGVALHWVGASGTISIS